MVAVASQVLQHDTRPVGAANHIDAVISEPLSHRVEVFNRIERRVLGQIGLPGQAIAARFDRWQVISRHHDIRWVIEVFTVERPGPARAALVDEHMVTIALEWQPRPDRRRDLSPGRWGRLQSRISDQVGVASPMPGRPSRSAQYAARPACCGLLVLTADRRASPGPAWRPHTA